MRPIFSLIYIPLRKPRIERGRFELSRKSIRDVEVVPSLQRRSSRRKSKRCGKEEEENEEAGDGEDQGGPPLQVQQPHHHHSRLVTCLSGKDKLSTEIEVDFARPLWMNIVHPRLAWLSQPRLSRAALRLLWITNVPDFQWYGSSIKIKKYKL